MANLQSRTELNEAPNDLDIVHIVDVSDATDDVLGTSKKITIANLIKTYVEALTSYFNKTTDDSDSITEGIVNLFLTTTERTNIANSYKQGGTDVAVADGGTGASTAAGARTALGVDPAGTDNSTPVTVTDSAEVDFTLVGQNITAVLLANSVAVGKLSAGVQTSLGKADTAEQVANKDALNGYAGLDASGLINPLQLPALAISTTSVVASEAAQLALTVQEGDIAVRSDLNKSYIALNSTNATMTDWQELLTPTDAVQSVFGRSGTVTAQNGDYTASQVGADPAGTDNSTDVTLAGTPNYITIVGQVITRALIDLANHVTGLLPDANIASATTWNGKIANVVEDTTPQAGGNFDMNQKFIGVATIKDLGTVTTGTTIDLNSFGNWFKVTLGANVAFTVTTPTGLNGRWELWLVQDATGARVPTWPANFVWPEGEPAWASMTASQAVKITVSWDGTNNVAIGTTPY